MSGNNNNPQTVANSLETNFLKIKKEVEDIKDTIGDVETVLDNILAGN